MTTVNEPLTYQRCLELMDTCRDHTKGKPIRNNTRLYRSKYRYGQYVVYKFNVLLHGNNIMTILPHGIVISDGGWGSSTTKMRLNKYLPSHLSIRARKWVWYLVNTHMDTEEEFVDGMSINWKGEVQCPSTVVDGKVVMNPDYLTRDHSYFTYLHEQHSVEQSTSHDDWAKKPIDHTMGVA